MNFRNIFINNPWVGKILGCLFGAFIAGPAGALIGLIIGNFFDKGLASHFLHPLLPYQRLNNKTVQAIFFEATFAIMGHIAKSDGRVSEHEIQIATRLMDEMSLNKSQRKLAQNFFNQGKAWSYNTTRILRLLGQSLRAYPDLLKLFMEIQYNAARADGLTREKIAAVNAVFRQLGFAPLNEQPRFYEDFTFTWSDRPQYNQQSYQRTKTRRPGYNSFSLAEAYEILEVDPTANKVEVKKAYRKQMSRNHPDKLIAQGLPESMIKLANDKTQKITKAYEQICESKGW